MASESVIGRSTKLVDGPGKVRGVTLYATDITLPRMLHARLVTSTYPHARLNGVHVDDALAVPGVVRVLTAEDLPDIVSSSRHRLLLARDRVIFVGQPIALVLAESEAAAQDGADLVYADYDLLPVPATLEEAQAEDAPLVWPDGIPGESDEAGAHGAAVGGQEESAGKRSNISKRRRYTRGDVTAALQQSDIVLERTFETSWVHQSYLEPHATVAQADPMTGGMTVWTSTQSPFYVQDEVADILGVPVSDVRVTPTTVGGAFGGKFILYEPLVALAARLTGRPVRLVLTRMEEMQAGNPASGARIKVKLGANRDGSLTALDADLLYESGCYPGSPMGIAAYLMGSLYQIPNFDIRGTEVLTFKPSQGAYRAPGAPQATLVVDTLVDEVARLIEQDPIDVRLQNASRPGDPMANDKPWPSMGMTEVLEALRDHPAWKERATARAAGRGVGIAIGGWPGGTEPAAASCMIQRDGTLHVHIGSVDLNGTDTGFALIAAETFGIPADRVRIVKGDTSTMPYAGAAAGSKTTYTVGPAVVQAARDAREQVLQLAAEELEADPADLEIIEGKVQVRGVPDSAVEVGKLAEMSTEYGSRYAPIMGRGRHADPAESPGFSAQLAEVEVDPDTGAVRVHRLVIVQDVGKAINPAAVAGQMMGGAVQGLGWGLHEQILYDVQGQLLSGSWMDYDVPGIQETPPLDFVIVEVPSDHGPFGARGVGEPPVVPTAAAVANAIADATGVYLSTLPMTPPRLLSALQEQAQGEVTEPVGEPG